MAKTLHYRRHSIKDGSVKDTIGPKGLVLAFSEGVLCGTIHHKAFHGPLVRTAQTLLSFLQGRTGNSMIMPVVEEIGNDAFVAAIVNDAFKAAITEGKTNFEATLAAHDEAGLMELRKRAHGAVIKMFDAMEEGETAIAFGHSPIIELAALYLPDLPEGWSNLREMDGLVFFGQEDGHIGVSEITRANREATAQN